MTTQTVSSIKQSVASFLQRHGLFKTTPNGGEITAKQLKVLIHNNQHLQAVAAEVNRKLNNDFNLKHRSTWATFYNTLIEYFNAKALAERKTEEVKITLDLENADKRYVNYICCKNLNTINEADSSWRDQADSLFEPRYPSIVLSSACSVVNRSFNEHYPVFDREGATHVVNHIAEHVAINFWNNERIKMFLYDCGVGFSDSVWHIACELPVRCPLPKSNKFDESSLVNVDSYPTTENPILRYPQRVQSADGYKFWLQGNEYTDGDMTFDAEVVYQQIVNPDPDSVLPEFDAIED